MQDKYETPEDQVDSDANKINDNNGSRPVDDKQDADSWHACPVAPNAKPSDHQ